jgi:type VI secretion system protein ImpC
MAKAKNTAAEVRVAENSLLEQILEQTRLAPADEGYDVAKRGIEVMLKQLFSSKRTGERVDKRLVEQMIDELDARLSAQLDEVLHHPEFQALESAWRGLRFTVDRTDFKENTLIQFVNVSKEDLSQDFDDAPDITKTGIYRHLYTDQYGQFGGEPVGVIVGDYAFGPGANDIKLLQNMAAISAMTHAPFVASASAEFLGVDDFDKHSDLKELESIFESPRYAKWHSFRESDNARNVGLALPRFLLRTPYGSENPTREFNYTEGCGEVKSKYLWGNASLAFATRLTESFAEYRWCPNIIGPQSGGAVKDLPANVVSHDGQDTMIGPVETAISDRREYEFSELGFIPLTLRKGSDSATFFSANSVQKVKQYGNDAEGKAAELNHKLGTQLPYLFIVNRLAHYIKVLQRENLGSWKSRADLETELNKWLRQYVADQENPSPATRSQRPLRRAQISVSEVDGEAGWYKIALEVTPHFKFMGANFTLSLSGMLDKV